MMGRTGGVNQYLLGEGKEHTNQFFLGGRMGRVNKGCGEEERRAQINIVWGDNVVCILML